MTYIWLSYQHAYKCNISNAKTVLSCIKVKIHRLLWYDLFLIFSLECCRLYNREKTAELLLAQIKAW